jgi:hypothetical protein
MCRSEVDSCETFFSLTVSRESVSFVAAQLSRPPRAHHIHVTHIRSERRERRFGKFIFPKAMASLRVKKARSELDRYLGVQLDTPTLILLKM